MPFKKTAHAIGKKQTPMPGPASAAYKKIVAAKKTAASKKAVSKKRHKSSAAFSTTKSRQQVVERVRRDIWASVQQINEAIINLALCGNAAAAKALFDFAGVYSLPEPDGEASVAPAPAAAPVASAAAASPTPLNPVDAFFKSIGIDAPCDEHEPDMAA